MLEQLGEIGRLQEEKPSENKSLHEMTRNEINEEIARLRPVSTLGIRRRIVSKEKTPNKSKASRESKRPTLRRAKRANGGEAPSTF